MTKTVRVAAAQFVVGNDIEENLVSCLRVLDEAAKCQPDLVVLPEFCNHLSWYDDKEHCYRVSVAEEGEFLQAIAAKAKQIGAHVVVNVTLQQDDATATGTSLLYSPEGELLGGHDKEVLIGHENDFLERATSQGPVIETPLGKLGLYACMDGVINETPRCIALRGAQIMCNSLNSFAIDEGSLHIPVRAAENKVFVVAANKIGPLIPQELLEPVSAATSIPIKFLNGAGDSQIVAPDGTVLAMASKDKEEVVYADIDVSQASDKRRPDGTDIFASRRASLYQSIADDPATQAVGSFKGADEMQAAIVQLDAQGEGALSQATALISDAIKAGAKLVVLPELFFLTSLDDMADAAQRSTQMIDTLQACCADDSYIATSAIVSKGSDFQHCAILIGREGVVLSQPQLHSSQRLSGISLGDEMLSLQLPFGRIGMVTGDDSIYPETFRLLALQGVEVVAVPFAIQESWEAGTGLIERAAENRMNLVAATIPTSEGSSLALSLQQDFTVMTPWENREFDGLLSQPILTRATGNAGVTSVTLFPNSAENKMVSSSTDLLAGRPWYLAQAIVE